MSIRTILADSIASFKEEEGLTYNQLAEVTGLNKQQLTRIIKKKGEGVSIDLMEDVCKNKIYYNVILEVY